MYAYVIRRLLALIPTWIAIGIVAFTLIRLAPGDPAAAMLGMDSMEGRDEMRASLGLDRPVLVQLGDFLWRAVQGDLGQSYFLGRTVAEAIVERIPTTLSLATMGILIALGMGMPLGVWAALRPNSYEDATVMGISLLGLSVPNFFLGLVLIYIFAVWLRLMPAGGFVPLSEGLWDWLRHVIMPALTLGVMQAALIARMSRSSMMEVMGSDYIRTARSKGVRERKVIWLHAMKNAIIPVVTVTGVIFAVLLSGSFITEVLFRMPGVGSLVIAAVKRRDYPIVQGGLLVFSTSVLVMNLVVDLLYAYLDPRIKYE